MDDRPGEGDFGRTTTEARKGTEDRVGMMDDTDAFDRLYLLASTCTRDQHTHLLDTKEGGDLRRTEERESAGRQECRRGNSFSDNFGLDRSFLPDDFWPRSYLDYPNSPQIQTSYSPPELVSSTPVGSSTSRWEEPRSFPNCALDGYSLADPSLSAYSSNDRQTSYPQSMHGTTSEPYVSCPEGPIPHHRATYGNYPFLPLNTFPSTSEDCPHDAVAIRREAELEPTTPSSGTFAPRIVAPYHGTVDYGFPASYGTHDPCSPRTSTRDESRRCSWPLETRSYSSSLNPMHLLPSTILTPLTDMSATSRSFQELSETHGLGASHLWLETSTERQPMIAYELEPQSRQSPQRTSALRVKRLRPEVDTDMDSWSSRQRYEGHSQGEGDTIRAEEARTEPEGCEGSKAESSTDRQLVSEIPSRHPSPTHPTWNKKRLLSTEVSGSETREGSSNVSFWGPFEATSTLLDKEKRVVNFSSTISRPSSIHYDAGIASYLTYRRNFFQFTVSVKFDGSGTPLPFHATTMTSSPISEYHVSLEALTYPRGSPVELLQFDTSRSLATSIPVQRRPLSMQVTSSTDFDDDDDDPRNSAMTALELSTNFSRIQFRASTSNHPNAHAQASNYHFQLRVNLIAVHDDGFETALGFWDSAKLIVRGRSPGQFERSQKKKLSRKKETLESRCGSGQGKKNLKRIAIKSRK